MAYINGWEVDYTGSPVETERDKLDSAISEAYLKYPNALVEVTLEDGETLVLSTDD